MVEGQLIEQREPVLTVGGFTMIAETIVRGAHSHEAPFFLNTLPAWCAAKRMKEGATPAEYANEMWADFLMWDAMSDWKDEDPQIDPEDL